MMEIAANLPMNSRAVPAQPARDRGHRNTGHDPVLDLLTLGQVDVRVVHSYANP
jgi:hypothetical protein